MLVSLPVFWPESAEMADIFEARLNPASCELFSFTPPVLTSLSTGPTDSTSSESVPPLSCEPGGRTTPTAGSTACNSSTGIFWPTSLVRMDVVSPRVSYVPVSLASAFPIATSPCVRRPDCARRLCSTVYFTSIGRPEGAPLGVNFRLVAFNVPLVLAVRPSDMTDPSKSAKPVIPAPGSTNADWERSSLLMFNFACRGVSETSCVLIGPSVPSSFTLPPPGRRIDAVTGNALPMLKFRIEMSTLSYTIGLRLAGIAPKEILPSVSSSLATFRLLVLVDFSGVFFSELPSEEKFHTPAWLRSSAISGSSMTNSVTLSCLLKIRGINSTPTLSDFALINGALLNLGSSAMESWSARTPPENRLRLKLPTVTGRPRASLSLDSICGRKLLTFTRKGSAMAATSSTATTIPMIFRAVFTAIPPGTGWAGRGLEGEPSSVYQNL